MGIEIPRVQTQNREVNQLQSNIISSLLPLTRNPATQGNLLTSQSLAVGTNVVNHGLGRTLQGWIIVRLRGLAQIYDTQDDNTNQSTLTLVSNASVVVDLYCF